MIELPEISKDDDINNFIVDKEIKELEKENDQQLIFKNKENIPFLDCFHCLVYVFFIILIILLFIINYHKTKDNMNIQLELNKNYNINLDPKLVCSNLINGFKLCLKDSNKTNCTIIYSQVESCIDNTNALVRDCHLYLYEYITCRDNIIKAKHNNYNGSIIDNSLIFIKEKINVFKCYLNKIDLRGCIHYFDNIESNNVIELL